MVPEGPFPVFTLIYCRVDGFGIARRAAFLSAAEARNHAAARLRAQAAEWVSVAVAHGQDLDLEFLGAWDRDAAGRLSWEAASLA